MSKHPTSITTPTPLESFINAPLTPPPSDTKPSAQVSHIIGYLRLRKKGYGHLQPWTVFQLQLGDFKQLLALVQADPILWSFFNNKVRHDYFSQSCCFILRMPTRTHEFFGSSIVSKILRHLGTIAKRKGKAAEFARSVSYTGSPRLHFPVNGDRDKEDNNSGDTHTQEEDKARVKYDSHKPDATFSHTSAQWLGVIIEVSFSQKEMDLKNLAKDYILGSDENIQVVIGLNIEYKNSKKASLSIWRPQYMKDEDKQEYLVSAQTVCEQLFRDELGNPTGADTGLTLHLQDFDSTAETSSSATLLTHPIAISSSTLYNSYALKNRV